MLVVEEGDKILELLERVPQDTRLTKVPEEFYYNLSPTRVGRIKTILSSGYIIVFSKLETWSIY
jgi:hypothetical protein